MSNYIPEASYDLYAGTGDKTYTDVFAYFDYNTPTDVVTNESAISNSIRNILLTRIGSMPGKPEFGSNVMKSLFELMDGQSTKDLLKNNIMTALLRWEPRIEVNEVVIKEIPEYNRIVCDVKYTYNIMGGNIDGKTSIVLKD